MGKHKLNCAANKLRLGAAYVDTDLVIVHPNGKPIYPEYLRHLCASIVLMQGVNIMVSQEHLGHKDISTTVNIKNLYEQLEELKQLDHAC